MTGRGKFGKGRTLAVGICTALGLGGCLKPTTQVAELRSSQLTAAPADDHPNSPSLIPATGFAFSPVAAQTMELGITSKLVTLNLSAANDYSGTLDLRVEADEIRAVDPVGFVAISVTPSQVVLSPGQTAQVNVTLSTDTQAPSFNSRFHVRATEAGGSQTAQTTGAEIPLKVNAVYEARMMGGAAPEQWSVPSTLAFRPHAGGLTVNFVNLDSAQTHIVHGNGAIPHGNTGTPMAKAVAGVPQPGGTYAVTVPAGTQRSGSFYCHSHEGGGSAKNVTFNNGQAAATFTSVSANILNSKCVSCHGSAGGVSLGSYNDVSQSLVPGNANASKLFQAVLNNSMPPGSPLTSAEKLAIFDWINAGAPNN